MAFNKTTQAAKLVENVGQFSPLAYGIAVLAAGSAVVKVPGLSLVEGGIAQSQTSNAARVSATDGNTLTITGTGTDSVMWIAWGKPKA